MKKLINSCLWLLCTVGLLQADEYICSQPVLSIHKEPRVLSEVVSQLIWSDSVLVTEKVQEGWVKVLTKDQIEGYVPFGGLVQYEDSTYPKPTKASLVTSLFAHVYLVRDITTYPPLLTLPYGAKIEVANALDVQADRFVKVRLVNGEVGYMLRSDIQSNPQALRVDEVVSLAKQFIGVPYTWGGASSYGFDARGFIGFLYRQMGIDLPRDISEMSTMATMHDVHPDALSPGDLLFFSQRDDGQIDHVGLYLGKGDFIHTSPKNTPPGVQLGSLKTPYWQLSFKKAMKASP